jgi:phospholipid-binding lipoprotein MlaA
MRFALNSTWGLLGLLDIASEAGLPKHDEDLGQTLGRWGVGEGAYIVLPFFGPRTVRDAVALPADMMGNEPFSIDHVPTRNTVLGTRVVHGRSVLLGADRTLKEAALDRYAFVRDFYLEQRRYKVGDGRQERVYEDFDEQSALPLGGEVDAAAATAVEHLELAGIGANPVKVGRRAVRQTVQ